MKYVFIALFLSSVSLYPYELRLHFSRSYAYDDILYADVYAGGNVWVDENIKRYIDNGIIIFLNFRIVLLKKEIIFDETVADIFLYRRIYYDFFTKEYVVVNSETMREIRNDNFYVLLRNVRQINRIEIENTNRLKSDGVYFFKTRLSVRFQNAYPYLSVFFNAITPLRYRIKWLKSSEFSLRELY